MSLVVFTGMIGLLIAPGRLNPVLGFTAVLCIAVAAGRVRRHQHVVRSRHRRGDAAHPEPPYSGGRIPAGAALGYGIVLASGAVLIMAIATNLAAAAVLALSIFFYVFVYTMWLKRRTPQNIVIGGAAGAFPPSSAGRR